MRVAIDKRPLESGHSVRGVGVYTRELIRSLEQEAKKLKGFQISAINFQKEDLKKYDIIHYPYFNPFFITLPIKKFAKVVVTIHDLIPLIYPKHYPPGIKGKFSFFIQRRLVNNADAIITDSETSKKDIVRFLRITERKIKVIHLAPRPLFKQITNLKLLMKVRKKYQLPTKFVLYVGDVNFNKNIIGLIKACEIAKTPLVICGEQAEKIKDTKLNPRNFIGLRDWFRFFFNIPHPELAHYRELVRKFRENSNILRLGFVPDEDLVAIYNLASVYCQPSFYEGFGLPVLEAMMCKCPVVVSKTNALVEIASDAALIADPKDQKDLADKIISILRNANLRANLVRLGAKRSREFSWKKVARETLKIYKGLLVDNK